MKFLSAIAALGLAILARPALAQEVNYQQEVTFSGSLSQVFATVYDPVNPADVSDPGSHMLVGAGPNRGNYYVFSSTAATSARQLFPPELNLDPQFSLTAVTGFGTVAPRIYFYNALNQIITFNLTTFEIVSQPFVDGILEASSLALSSGASHTTLIGMIVDGSHGGFEINLQTGAATKVFSTDGDGALSTSTLYQHYGADGMLYLLDYGNNRVVALDPDNSYAQAFTFTLQSTVANMQFAMGADGSIFLGDGAGGGSMYSATGTLLDTFALPDGSYTDPFTSGIAPYVDYTPDGHVFVFDNTGAHQYEVVPEPSTWALLALGFIGTVLWRRKPKRLGLFAFAALASSSLAQEVSYQQEVTFPGLVDPVLATVYDPVNPADVSDPGSHWLVMVGPTSAEYYNFSSTAATSNIQTIRGILLDPQFSHSAITGFGTPSGKAYFFNALNEILTYNLTTSTTESFHFVNDIIEAYSLAVSSGASHTTVIGQGAEGDHGGFELNLQTGAATKVFSTEGDGALSTSTLYQHYGADGMLYLLDYGNDRVEVLNPDNAFAEVRHFTLQSTVANMQFAMDDHNDIFFGDGAGGGSMYSSTGTLLDTFALPSGDYTDPFPAGSNPYLDYTPDGHVFVFDTTGAHQFAVVPEPGTVALLTMGGVGFWTWRRRKSSASPR